MVRFPACSPKNVRALALALTVCAMFAGTGSAQGQASYATPDAAANALVDALATNDPDATSHVLGKNYSHFIPTENIGQEDIYAFLAAWSQGHNIVYDEPSAHGKRSAHLAVGTSGWTLPVPLVHGVDGWHFDPRAATDEILTRRIGRNERAAMMTSLAWLDAQNEYRNLNKHYAIRFISTPGKRDGLYWSVEPGEAQSPLGPLANIMPPGPDLARNGYYGYHYRVLTAQGSHAMGGTKEYVRNGLLTEGCALVAWPVEYGKTGVMSFIINQDGQLYEKDLGPRTTQIAVALRAFDPDRSWRPVAP
ncbi:DUF2950 domain-containing protein [Burkholderia stabilis]|uniref:DUF2950 domain-containing protein n=1 Tax=Burkholderia stabilis TaxID=95485 RepID=A0A4Q2A5X0_9BURK|nr:DUF2950 domain-containing protein [Burkholderia stabilis]RXV64579.1 DUF2950 domain-containing protein [Burkholderia stabilis]